ncbi:hypothetical protein C9374_009870 [Naegleria lovaniensis]|uniref:CYRIA/CYRIB Rac1 binding domain-containing protein n=1 Tax=Naegleria lovaniensis TaxID=51637 RepID=A0AA88KJU4_NAELO|nr:uncharacterized protein C9374_009870 [Naegleria lovaniensis]KAG2375247.1 hypothetical protein C9374_009870 [Naegleria lovaniensis]
MSVEDNSNPMENTKQRLKVLNSYMVESNQPTIEAASDYISYETGAFTSPLYLADRDGYATRFAKEAESIQVLQEINERGEAFIHTLYTYRSISRALPQVQADADNKAELYRKFFDVLEPEIRKIRDLMAFHNETVKTLTRIIVEMVANEKRKEIPSETMFDYLIQVLDTILKLDALKNMKAAINNDMATVKRASQFMDKSGLTPDQLNFLDTKSEENALLYSFLSNNNSIISGLKDSLIKNAGYEDIIILLIERCADNFEQGQYLFCDQKHSLLRVLVFGIYLIDNKDTSKNNYLKKIGSNSLSRFYKLFKSYPNIPLYGDMTFSIKTVLKNCPNLSEKDWTLSPKEEEQLAKQFLLIHRIPKMRYDFQTFTKSYKLHINRMKKLIKDSPTNQELLTIIPQPIREKAKEITEQGLRLIASWTTAVLEQCAWKYSHPIEDEQARQMKQRQESDDNLSSVLLEYERVVRFNYDKDERSALVDAISMIKGLENIMLQQNAMMAPLIRSEIHYQLQQFIQVDLQELLYHTKNKQRPIFPTVLELRNLAGDWLSDPPQEITKPSKKKGETALEFPKRIVGPSFTQLHMIRSIVSTLYSERSPGMQKSGIFSKKDFNDSHVEILRDFYNKTYMWNYLLAYSTSFRRAADLADLWYREFYLEISKKIQFPIEMSLPWILTEEILKRTNSALMESIIYPINIYNDAAYRALFVLKRRFLYDEIEAEVNLVFDQLIYKLSESIYKHYRTVALGILLDNKLRVPLEKDPNVKTNYNFTCSKFDVLLLQKHINILGRFVDLNYIITQRMNINIRENILALIKKFESQELTGIVELEVMLESVKITHQLLSRHLALDSFESVFAEVNDSTSVVSFESRIARHILEELVMDFFPNYCFNTVTHRFVRSKYTYSDLEYKRENYKIRSLHQYVTASFSEAFIPLLDQYKEFIGRPHMESMIRLVGQESLALIIESSITYIEDKLYNDMSPYIGAMMEAIPPKITLQPAAYKLIGVYAYFTAQFRDFLEYEDLKGGVFQAFRSIGNCICFLLLIDSSMMPQNIATYIASAPFLGIRPLTKSAKQKRAEKLQEEMDSEDDFAQQQEQTRNTLSRKGSRYGLTSEHLMSEDLLLLQKITDYYIRKDVDHAPLTSTIAQFVNDPQVQQNIHAPELSKKLTEQATRAVKMYQPPRELLSLFKQFLERMSGFLSNVRESWKGTSPPDRLQKLDSSKEFYRLWGVLQFVFCIPPEVANEPTDFEVFGDGFFWAGCTIVYLFQQHLRFDAFNFSDHVLNISNISKEGMEKLKPFLNNAHIIRSINNRVFNCLRSYYPLVDNTPDDYTPPTDEDFTKVRVVATVNTDNSSSFSSFRQSPATNAYSQPTPPPPPSSQPIYIDQSYDANTYSSSPSSSNSPSLSVPPPPPRSEMPPPPPPMRVGGGVPPPPPRGY